MSKRTTGETDEQAFLRHALRSAPPDHPDNDHNWYAIGIEQGMEAELQTAEQLLLNNPEPADKQKAWDVIRSGINNRLAAAPRIARDISPDDNDHAENVEEIILMHMMGISVTGRLKAQQNQ